MDELYEVYIHTHTHVYFQHDAAESRSFHVCAACARGNLNPIVMRKFPAMRENDVYDMCDV